MNPFELDERLSSTCYYLCDWPLSSVLLKNSTHYPWTILVPRRCDVNEITLLSKTDRHQLMDELYHLTQIMQMIFKPDKINTAALGNIVPQLHVHVVARFKKDALWPQGIWQASLYEAVYETPPTQLIATLVHELSSCFDSGE